MKTRFIINIILFVLVFVSSNLKAETIFFDSKNIKIEENGNMIFATKGKANIPSSNLIIEGDKFIYNKKISELIVLDDVKYFDRENKVYIESQKIIYNEVTNTIFSKSDTYIKYEDDYKINSSDVLYNRTSNEILSNQFTKITDKNQNKFQFNKGLIFELVPEIISSKEVNVVDENLNSYFFEDSRIKLKINEIAGKEIFINFENSFFGNKKNDPLLKGKSVISNNDKTKIYKTVFSTCNKLNKNCRGWEIQSNLFTHNKTKKLFEYEKSWFKVFDKKVLYIPYFNHPDPSVKRKSGFLTPFYKGSENLGSSISVPYFYSISNSKDLTFKPRIYMDNDLIFHSEYREAFKNSNLKTDFSFNRNDNDTNSHIFLNLNGEYNDNTEYNLKIENVNNDNYLKIHDIKSYTPIIESDSVLTSSFEVETDIDNNTRLNSTVRLYEDLSKKSSDKYQYIFPDFNFEKNIDLDKNYNGQFKFLSSGFQKIYDTNIYETLLNNDFNFESYDFISSNGIVTDYSFLLKNFNTYSENSTVYENKNDHEIFGTFLLKSELPLKKNLNKGNNFLKPIAQLRFSPTNGKNISSTGSRMDYSNIFSPNRIGRTDMVEKGNSLTLGLEFEKQNFENEKVFGFNLGNIFKDEKNHTLPNKSKLNQTRSDIVGDIFYKLEDKFELKYNFSYDRDLDFSNYDAITAKLGSNKLVTTFDYITENHELGNSELISNNTEIKFTDEHSIKFDTTKDLKDDFTQFYKLAYQYETDCLSASFEYEKKFFSDGSLKPDESLYFLIRFIPFAELRGSANTIFE
tara:strand:+ start:2268 stop:4661 length:2394 start_codon:yes stop_codon:yes gene_type:complete